MGNTATICNSVGLKRSITLLVVGLDNAGKTCTVKALVGESYENVTPTVGFSKYATQIQGIRVEIYDLGGGARIRDIWKNYFAEAHGVVYVIDASNDSRISESRAILEGLIQDPLLQQKPLLLLANKQDCEDALDEIDISEKLQLEFLANSNETPTRIEICSARQGSGKKVDPAIRLGFRWLVEWILRNHEVLHKRIQDDLTAQKEQHDREREERRQRLRRIADEEGTADKEIEDLEANAPFQRNPFRPINEIAETWNLPGSVQQDLNVHNHSHILAAHDTSRNGNLLDQEDSASVPAQTSEAQYEPKKTVEDGDTQKRRLFSMKNNKTAPLFNVTEANLRSRLPPLKPLTGQVTSLFSKDPK